MTVHYRFARPVADLERSRRMYRDALGWEVLGHFEDHEGFDGAMLGPRGAPFHLELTYCRDHPVPPRPTPEDLLVVYEPGTVEWRMRCSALIAAGFREVEAFNPYWGKAGRTFEDADGYRMVICREAWPPRP